jgi:hypothetical protein
LIHERIVFNPIRRFYPYRFLPDPKGRVLPHGVRQAAGPYGRHGRPIAGAIVDTAKSESENGGVLAGGGFGLPDKIEMKGNRVTTVNTDGAPLADMFAVPGESRFRRAPCAVLEKVMTLGDRLAGTLELAGERPGVHDGHHGEGHH